MALFDDLFSGGNWVTGLALGVAAVVILPLAAPILRPLAKTAIKGGILAYRAAGLFEGVGDLVAEAVAETGGEAATQAPEGPTHASEIASPRPAGLEREQEVRQENPGRWAGVSGHGNGWKGR